MVLLFKCRSFKKCSQILLPGQRIYGHHRCVTPLYRIPMWIFDRVDIKIQSQL